MDEQKEKYTESTPTETTQEPVQPAHRLMPYFIQEYLAQLMESNRRKAKLPKAVMKKRLAKKQLKRKVQKESRKHNRGTKGRTQLHRHR